MATGPLVWLQFPAIWHKGVCDGNKAWPHATREIEMATGSGQMAPLRLGWKQSLATWHQGRRDYDRAWPHGTRVAGMALGHGQMTPGRLGLHKGLANVTRVLGWL